MIFVHGFNKRLISQYHWWQLQVGYRWHNIGILLSLLLILDPFRTVFQQIPGISTYVFSDTMQCVKHNKSCDATAGNTTSAAIIVYGPESTFFFLLLLLSCQFKMSVFTVQKKTWKLCVIFIVVCLWKKGHFNFPLHTFCLKFKTLSRCLIYRF